ncbi:MAG: SDR family oxidoreductase [Candidatus Sungbacteria bacterium]|uniref:SDR family oxidoreductase n=1 Tax=Candidatus Sungiibacteriota bacterium TaxID=2750080 RepID=A0A9D6LSG8_9BACT|nr:SDR family oxidoreductase [Candidatus Sungbacteria bacterium]
MKNKIVVITGASSGIGRATALEFAKEGNRLLLTYNKHKNEAEKVADEVKELGASDVRFFHLDITSDESLKNFAEAIKKAGGADVLVNNAGVNVRKKLEDQSFDEIELQMKTNLLELIKLTKELLPLIRESIINISSGLGKQGMQMESVYSATKFGVRGFTQSIAEEYPSLYIVSVNPDTTKTPMTEFHGRPPEDVARAIVRAAKREYKVPSGGDIDIWMVYRNT